MRASEATVCGSASNETAVKKVRLFGEPFESLRPQYMFDVEEIFTFGGRLEYPPTFLLSCNLRGAEGFQYLSVSLSGTLAWLLVHATRHKPVNFVLGNLAKMPAHRRVLCKGFVRPSVGKEYVTFSPATSR